MAGPWRRLVDATLRRDLRVLSGAGRGLCFNPHHGIARYALGYVERRVQRFLSRVVRPGMVVYDVGAFVGFHAVLLGRLVGSGGRVVCFEPVPENAAAIRHNARLNGFEQVEVHEVALGEEDGERMMWIDARRDLSRLRQSHAEGESGNAGNGRWTAVPVRRLDTMADQGIRLPHMMKIDVEGAEVDVLAGAVKTLDRVRPVLLVETHGTDRAVRARLGHLAYEVSGLDDTHLVARPIRPAETGASENASRAARCASRGRHASDPEL